VILSVSAVLPTAARIVAVASEVPASVFRMVVA